MSKKWKFEIGQMVETRFGQKRKGEIVGRAEYQNAGDSYLVRTANGHGDQIEDWFGELAIHPAG